MLRTLLKILGRPRELVRLFATFLVLLVLVFLVGERAFVAHVITGNFPLWLFLSILPTLFVSFFIGNGYVLTIHYLVISLLLSIYIVLVRHIFIERRFISFKSMTVGLTGLVGISLGLSCLSCGALAGLFLASLFGASAAGATLFHNTALFLIFGEALLIVAIGLVLAALGKLGQ